MEDRAIGEPDLGDANALFGIMDDCGGSIFE